MTHKLSYYLLKEEYYGLLCDYLDDFSSHLEIKITIGDHTFTLRSKQMWIKSGLEVSHVLISATLAEMITMQDIEHIRRAINGMDYSDRIKWGASNASFSVKIIDGNACYTLSTPCTIEKLSTNVEDPKAFQNDKEKHKYIIDFLVAVKEKSDFTIMKE
jgi:hypothetical protein